MTTLFIPEFLFPQLGFGDSPLPQSDKNTQKRSIKVAIRTIRKRLFLCESAARVAIITKKAHRKRRTGGKQHFN